jgi:SAM-dependent methyltransferase
VSDGTIETEQSEPTGERFEPIAMHGQIIEAEHLARYAWAAQFAPGKRVLDAACGLAYGTAILLAAGAEEVVGIDLDADVIAKVSAAAAPNSKFDVGDLRDLPYPDHKFDLVTCFESIEHVSDPEVVLDELHRVLHPTGLLVLSTPNRDVYTPGNPFHMRELTPNELEEELSNRFGSVRLRRQHTWISSGVFDDDDFRLSDHELLTGLEVRKAAANDPGSETYTLALASDGAIPADRGLLSLTSDVDLREWTKYMELAKQNAEVARDRVAPERDAELTLMRDELNELRQRLADNEIEIARLSESEAKLTSVSGMLHEYEVMVSSTSWRLTEPLRRLGSWLRRSRR